MSNAQHASTASDVDALALDVARRFTEEWDPQRRASLQVAIVQAIRAARAQPAELAFNLDAMLASCVPGGSVVDPQVVADNIRAWLTHHKTAASTEKQTWEIRIPARNNLDPISVFVQDQAWGRGRIVVTCYGNAWQGFWGAMGDRSVMQFVAQCDPDYVAGSMLQGRQTRIAKHERDYTTRIAAEVIAEFRTLIGERDAASGRHLG